MQKDTGLQGIKGLLLNSNHFDKKPPAHEWQDLALRIIDELCIPTFKRNSVFKICKDNHKETVLKAFNDTKELCERGERWKYFFKVIGGKGEYRPFDLKQNKYQKTNYRNKYQSKRQNTD